MASIKENMRSIIARLFPAHARKENDDIGSWGEEIAVEFLRKKGYRIIERNFRCKRGEIDIVASEGNSLVFVEVKTRSSTQFGEPEQAVNPEKLRHLQHTAYIYLRKNKIKPGGVRFRFDIVSILADWNTRKVVSIKLFKGIIERGIKIEWFCSASMNFTDNEEVVKLAAESGCKMVLLGIESERVDQLQEMNKKLNVKMGIESYNQVFEKIHKYGIAVLGAFIYGLESDTPEIMAHRTDYINDADIDAVQATILTPLPGTRLFNRMIEENKVIMNNYPDDWQHYHFAEVVFQHDLMEPDLMMKEIKNNWDKLYNEEILRKKFIRTLKKTKSTVAGIWSYGSNLQYYNLAFEHERPQRDLVDVFGLKDFNANPFLK